MAQNGEVERKFNVAVARASRLRTILKIYADETPARQMAAGTVAPLI
jgi:hypothetical protein